MQQFHTLRRGKERNPLRNQNTRTWCLIYSWGWVKKMKNNALHPCVYQLCSLFGGSPPEVPSIPHSCVFPDRHLVSTWTSGSQERERGTHTLPVSDSATVCPPLTPSKTRLRSSPAPYITHAALFTTPTIVIRLPNNPSAHSLLLAPPPFLTWLQNQPEPRQSSNIMLCCVGFSSPPLSRGIYVRRKHSLLCLFVKNTSPSSDSKATKWQNLQNDGCSFLSLYEPHKAMMGH